MSVSGEVVVGVDTSNYTTSLCAVDAASGAIIWENRRLLSVELGEQGLRQSAALFQHVAHLPTLLSGMKEALGGRAISCVGVSARPRPADGSYMPVFLSGVLCARALATGAAGSVPVVETSHQAGHIAAGLATTSLLVGEGEPFLALHLSGGTTDVLSVIRDAHDFKVVTLGESLDLHAGQFVDRVGVMLGLPFPSGPHLEKLAAGYAGELPTLPSVLRGHSPSFAGPYSAAQRLFKEGADAAAIAAAALRTVANTVEKLIRAAWERVGVCRVLLVGGVASNQLIHARLTERLGPRANLLYVCAPRYASDNAYGVACIARDWRIQDVRKVT